MQQLPVGGLLVGEQEFAVDGVIGLPVRAVDLGCREHGIHTECAVFIRCDRDEPLADLGVLHQVLE